VSQTSRNVIRPTFHACLRFTLLRLIPLRGTQPRSLSFGVRVC